MSRNFKEYTVDAFEEFVKGLELDRDVTHIQIHHTWKPTKADYVGERTIWGMWNYHVNTRGWSDIGQHFSVAPTGTLWDGRPLERNPAGISNHNTGGIMFEIIGNFDQGQDELEGKQLYAITRAVAVLLDKFDLSYDDIVFHREHSSKTCPGTGITKEWFIEMVKRSEDTIKKPKQQKVSEWAEDAYNWVVENRISDGSRPKDPVTREQVWTMLYRIHNKE